jgi:DNA-binding XRE family transcriptional regulator
MVKCRLNVILAERGILKKWLAEQVGITAASMSNIIKGGLPHLDTALRIAKVLDLAVEDIWILEEEKG